MRIAVIARNRVTKCASECVVVLERAPSLLTTEQAARYVRRAALAAREFEWADDPDSLLGEVAEVLNEWGRVSLRFLRAHPRPGAWALLDAGREAPIGADVVLVVDDECRVSEARTATNSDGREYAHLVPFNFD